MGEKFSLKDHLFNADSLGDLAAEFAAGVPGFDAEGFLAEVVPGLQGRELKERLDWIADCIEKRLSDDFDVMCGQLIAAMPPPLDPTLEDDDFGRFIHAIPGILAVRHGMETPEQALDLLEQATQRFSMEFYIRPFIAAHPEMTLPRLRAWTEHPNYHVRRLVSEGTRPRLPWAGKLDLPVDLTLPLLDRLHADPTRYVTRSVANHLNDIAKTDPEAVLDRLSRWQKARRQSKAELAWMARHALRVLIKDGHPGAMAFLGYVQDAEVSATLDMPGKVAIGDVLRFTVTLTSAAPLPVIVDYAIRFHRPGGQDGRKVFKLKTTRIGDAPLTLTKSHRLKGDATTFTLHPGPHVLEMQVNGIKRAEQEFDLT